MKAKDLFPTNMDLPLRVVAAVKRTGNAGPSGVPWLGPLLFFGGGASGAGGTLKNPLPPAAVLASPALSAFHCGWLSQLCALSHWWPVIPSETRQPRGLWHPEWPPVTWEGVGMLVAHASMGGHHTHPSFLTGQLWDRPHDGALLRCS